MLQPSNIWNTVRALVLAPVQFMTGAKAHIALFAGLVALVLVAAVSSADGASAQEGASGGYIDLRVVEDPDTPRRGELRISNVGTATAYDVKVVIDPP